MRAADMLVLTNMLAKIISEVDDLTAMLKEAVANDFRKNFEEEE